MQVFILILLLLFILVGSHEKTSAADNLSAQTIVVFNAAVPDAGERSHSHAASGTGNAALLSCSC